MCVPALHGVLSMQVIFAGKVLKDDSMQLKDVFASVTLLIFQEILPAICFYPK